MTRKKPQALASLPAKPDVTMTSDEIAAAARELHGFDIRAIGDRLWALRSGMRSQQLIKLTVVDELAHKSSVELELEGRWTIGEQRWQASLRDAVAALEAFSRVWAQASGLRISELGISGNHSTKDRRKRLAEHSCHLTELGKQGESLLGSVQALLDVPEKSGGKLARWQALLHKAGFTWLEVATLFTEEPLVWRPNRLDELMSREAESTRKFVERHLKDEFEATRVDRWFAEMLERAGRTKGDTP